jgi:hypothetical protein
MSLDAVDRTVEAIGHPNIPLGHEHGRRRKIGQIRRNASMVMVINHLLLKPMPEDGMPDVL